MRFSDFKDFLPSLVCRRLYQKNSKRDTIKVFKPIVKRKEKNMAQKAHSLSHTKYHFVFTPKYRRKVI